jgi:hypothetical protein
MDTRFGNPRFWRAPRPLSARAQYPNRLAGRWPARVVRAVAT